VIERLNKDFVSTMSIIDDVTKRADSGDAVAQQLVKNWKYPVEMMFLTPNGQLVSKINSFEDFPGVHQDVSAPPGKGKQRPPVDERAHVNAFLKHLADHFGGD
jgi:hypothetical protein